MSQKFPVNGFKWVTKLSKFDEHFIKNYDENSDKRYFLKVDFEYPRSLKVDFEYPRSLLNLYLNISCHLK